MVTHISGNSGESMDKKGHATTSGGKGGSSGMKRLSLEVGDSWYDISGYYQQDLFREMLARERKRTERSRNPFVLILIDIGELIRERGPKNITGIIAVQKIKESLAEIIRETDIRGWYEKQRVLGMIFTEIGEMNQQTLTEKVRKQIELAIGGWGTGQIEISAFSFPVHEQNGSSEVLIKFYPEAGSAPKKRGKLILKRIVDIAGGVIGVVLFAPLFILMPPLIKLTSKGPVFYRQERVGEKGQLFTLLKFRSMYINTDDSIHKEYVSKLIKGAVDDEKGVYKIQKDPRVTPIGRFLRKTSLDEIPQFLNVLKGDMSLVGPRPPIPYETAQYDLWHIRRIMESKPGITGIWQVEGRSQTSFDGMVRMDLQYLKKQSIWLDLKLILKTPFALLTAKGAY